MAFYGLQNALTKDDFSLQQLSEVVRRNPLRPEVFSRWFKSLGKSGVDSVHLLLSCCTFPAQGAGGGSGKGVQAAGADWLDFITGSRTLSLRSLLCSLLWIRKLPSSSWCMPPRGGCLA